MKDFYSDNKFFERFTKTADAVKHIQYLECLNLENITDKELEKYIDACFPIYCYTKGIIPAGAELFRARVSIDEEPFTKVKDIWAPPPEYIKSHGRANKPHEQIFYCAVNFRLAAFEVIQDFKNSFAPKSEIVFLTIGVWKTLVPLHVAMIIDSPVLHNIRNDIKQEFEKHQRLLNNRHLTEELVEANNLLTKFYAEQFTKRNIRSSHDYKISALFARRLKLSNSHVAEPFKNETFDGLNYPSVAMNFEGDNQAIFIERAETKLEIVNAIQVVCSKLDFENSKFVAGIMHEAKNIKNGIIDWKTEIYSPS